MDQKVRPGEFYRHFNNKLYQILAVAEHSETGEEMVVYQALYGDYKVYVRPYAMFVSEVDHEKYPQVQQKYRFQRVLPGEDMQPLPDSQEEAASRALMEFLDSESYEARIASLKRMRKTVTQRELDSIYTVLDMKPQTGSIEEQLRAIAGCLKMQHHFDGGHLR